jgi:hypothetical protein
VAVLLLGNGWRESNGIKQTKVLIMKTLKSLIAIVALGGLLAAGAKAQTATNGTPPLPPVGNPLTAILGYAFDTNSTLLAEEKMELRLGAIQQGLDGGGVGASIGLSYNFTPVIGAGLRVISANVGGTIISSDLTLEVSKAYGNFKITGLLGGGYNVAAQTVDGVAGVRLSVIPLAATTRMGIYTQLAAKINGKFKSSLTTPSGELELGVFYPF